MFDFAMEGDDDEDFFAHFPNFGGFGDHLGGFGDVHFEEHSRSQGEHVVLLPMFIHAVKSLASTHEHLTFKGTCYIWYLGSCDVSNYWDT